MRMTVIVPTFERAESVRIALGSLLVAARDVSEVEILVVDNNIDDSLARDLQGFCASLDERVRYERESSPGVAAARHRGAAMARGEILAFVDDDIEVAPHWLQAIAALFDDPAISIVGGPSIPRFLGSVPAWLWEFVEPTPYGGWTCVWLSLLDLGRTVVDIDPDWIWTQNLAIRRSEFDRLGGQHPCYVPAEFQRWQGDGETGLTRKAKAAGVRASYAQEALVFHRVGPERLTPAYFRRRAFYQGVCDSFSRIRSGAEPQMPAGGFGADRSPALAAAEGWSLSADEVRADSSAAYREGWEFHQREAAADPELVAWIRRADYRRTDLRAERARRD